MCIPFPRVFGASIVNNLLLLHICRVEMVDQKEVNNSF
jgi:hypothetical protein